MADNKRVHVVGGGTFSHVRNHLSLAAPAFGETARKIAELCRQHSSKLDVDLHLTRMADPVESQLVTNADMLALAERLVKDLSTKIVFWNPALVDFDGMVDGVEAGKYAPRLCSIGTDGSATRHHIELASADKVLNIFRRGDGSPVAPRKDICLVSFKTTTGATEQEQYLAGLDLLKRSSSNLVLANDVVARRNMVIVPEEATYHITTNRDEALRGLVEMAYLRSHLTFTRSTVVAGEPVAWESGEVPATLRAVVDYCIERGAYRTFRGVTAGHFAVKLGETTFLTSRRKTDFNDMRNVGLVRVQTDGPDSVIAYGSKPSVGGQSQRIVFTEHPDANCIVHFHCPLKPGSSVPRGSQREYECGSHECGQNTSRGLTRFGNLLAVYLDNHGPNIVFHDSIDSQEVITFIEQNFDLQKKTGGYVAA